MIKGCLNEAPWSFSQSLLFFGSCFKNGDSQEMPPKQAGLRASQECLLGLTFGNAYLEFIEQYVFCLLVPPLGRERRFINPVGTVLTNLEKTTDYIRLKIANLLYTYSWSHKKAPILTAFIS